MVRANWYADHPAACTCVNCDEKRNIVEEKRTILQQHGPKIGRNAKCPCGSGKKYKRCHGG